MAAAAFSVFLAAMCLVVWGYGFRLIWRTPDGRRSLLIAVALLPVMILGIVVTGVNHGLTLSDFSRPFQAASAAETTMAGAQVLLFGLGQAVLIWSLAVVVLLILGFLLQWLWGDIHGLGNHLRTKKRKQAG